MSKWNLRKDPFIEREIQKYEHPIPSRELILECLTHHHDLSIRRLSSLFQLKTEFEREAFRRRLRAMVRDGQIARVRGKFNVIKQHNLVQGRILGHREGFGFLKPEDGTSDIFLSHHEMRSVFHGDIVEVRVIDIDHKHKRQGKIVRVIERGLEQIVGRFFWEKGVGFVVPDNSRINQDIIIPSKYRGEAKSGQIVNVEIISPPSKHTQAIGKVVEILGDYMAPGMEIEVAIRSHGIPHQFPEAVVRESKKFSQESIEIESVKRKDIRQLPLVTIDGEDAKDFDDAVYCEKKSDGGWRLIVAIADVSHYVKQGTEIDIEAQNRGNSVYFPGKVIPMLSHVLSNDLCSLNPHVDRLCLVCDMSITETGEINRYRFYSSVMRSHARLTYTQVAGLLQVSESAAWPKQYQSLFTPLKSLQALYQVLFQRRSERGALDFELPEVKVKFGKNRKIKQLVSVERNEAHRIIEESMLCANVSAAHFLLKHKLLALYRNHDGPNPDKFSDLKVFLGELGLSLGGGDLPVPIDYARLTAQIKDRPDRHLIQTVLLRSLSQAFYSPDNDGHFGLAYEEYAHFTSPIRRYPDLIVHRVIKSAIEKKTKNKLPSHEELKILGQHCSMTERRADEAVREALAWLKCEYMQDKLGENFSGIISSVTSFGVFVELRDIYIEGLLPLTDLQNDYYQFDAIRHRLIGERTGKIYRVGDEVQVKVARVSLEEKQIDFALK